MVVARFRVRKSLNRPPSCADVVLALDVARLALGTSFLAWGAVSDLRTRRVADRVWIVMGIFATVLFAVQIAAEGDLPAMYLAIVPSVALFFSVFYGRDIVDEHGWHAAVGHITAYIAAALSAIAGWFLLAGVPGGQAQFLAFLSAAGMMLVFRLFYQLRLLRGGADAKALMAIALMVPTYPTIPTLVPIDPRIATTLNIVFPFSFLVLLNAAFLFVFVPIALFAYNTSRRHAKLPEGLFGIRVPVDAVPKFSWLMDRIVAGRHIVYLMPRAETNRDDDLSALREAGFSEVWVTPQVPFIVAIAIGYVLSFLVGNVLVGIVRAVG